ncbi:MAG: Gfo/Idh/MocA family oxidoreductase [Phycisphaerales bacterium]|nr:Gfo/Idh/MocA family oxidoreductase [Phycisphaerales bacterium]
MTDVDRRTFLTHAAGGVAAMALVPNLSAFGSYSLNATLRVGVIGVGRQGREILGELTKLTDVEVTAMCDTDERRLSAGLRRASGAEGYNTVDEMLSSGKVDAAVVATSTHTHREVALKCFNAGVHVYLECPLAHTLEDCIAISEAARGAKGVIAAGLQGRANPVYQLARGFYKTDSVRDPVSMRAQQHRKTNWITPSNDSARYQDLNWKLDPNRSNGLAGEWGTQQFDVFHWYSDKYPVKVFGTGSVRHWRDDRKVPDTIACTLMFDDEQTIHYDASLANSYGGTYEVLYGSNAAIKLGWSHGWMFKEADAPTQGWEVYANRQQFHNDEGITLIAGATKLAEQGKLKEGIGLPHPGVYYALEDWVNAIATSGSPACSISEAARATAVGIAANEAVMKRGIVDINFSGL